MVCTYIRTLFLLINIVYAYVHMYAFHLQKWTALHWSVWSNKINCVKAIVNLRANVYALDTVSYVYTYMHHNKLK